MSGAPVLSVLIVNYRTPGLTLDCLASLAPERHEGITLDVVLVDNCSGDGSGEKLREAIAANGWGGEGGWVRLIESERNLGFAGGNNLALRHARAEADAVLLLNSDTIVEPGALRHCVERLLADPTIGALSCRVANADGSLQVVARRMPTPGRLILAQTGLPWKLPRLFGWAQLDYLSWDMDRDGGEPGWLGGAFLMMPGRLARELGGLDERFFFYGEDIEICHRIRRRGLRVVYDPSVTITHLGGSSSDPSRMPAQVRSEHAWRGRYMVQRLCYGRLAEASVRLADILGYGARVLAARLRGDEDAGSRLRANLGAILATRRAPS